VEQNPGLGMEGETFMQVFCGGCDRILKLERDRKRVVRGTVP